MRRPWPTGGCRAKKTLIWPTLYKYQDVYLEDVNIITYGFTMPKPTDVLFGEIETAEHKTPSEF
jgi:hypothetical protein